MNLTGRGWGPCSKSSGLNLDLFGFGPLDSHDRCHLALYSSYRTFQERRYEP